MDSHGSSVRSEAQYPQIPGGSIMRTKYLIGLICLTCSVLAVHATRQT